MINLIEPLDYARSTCDTMMKKFKAAELPPKGHFHYHQGVFLSGVYQTYLLSQHEPYFNYIQDWVDSVLDDCGNIRNFEPAHLDDMQPGILLYPLFERTGDIKYKQALDILIDNVPNIPRNQSGGFWHMKHMDNQMWLDGLYMAGPICAEYAKCFGRPDLTELVIKQALLMEEKTTDKKTALLYHAWDESKKAAWANKNTGLCSEFWGRSIGWVPVAVLNDLDFINEDIKGYENMVSLVKNLLHSLCQFQSDDGRWYQVVNKINAPGNWLENSCSCLYVAALCKAVRKEILDSCYLEHARKGYYGVINSITFDDQDIQIGNVCIGTGVGNYQYYIDRPVSVNDLHGVGAFLLMCSEMQQVM